MWSNHRYITINFNLYMVLIMVVPTMTVVKNKAITAGISINYSKKKNQ